MKIALINPPNPHHSHNIIRDTYVCRPVAAIPFPAMLAQLSAVIKKEFPSAKIQTLDAVAENYTLKQCAEAVTDCDSAFLFFSAHTILYDAPLLSLLHTQHPKAALFVIDPLSAGLYAESLLVEHACCSAVITDDVLRTVPDILARYPEIQTVNGLYLRSGESVTHSPPGTRRIQYDTLPYMAYDAIPLHRYSLSFLQAPFVEKLVPGIRMQTERFSPQLYPAGDASDNNVQQTSGAQTAMSASRIIGELAFAVKEWGIWGVEFIDWNFTRNTVRLESICNQITAQSLRMQWRCYSNGDHLTLPLLKIMRLAGCGEIILNCTGAPHNFLVMRRHIAMIHKAGIKVRIQMFIGLPWESENTLNRTCRWLRSANADHVSLLPVVPYPGTTLYTSCKENNLFEIRQPPLKTDTQHVWCGTEHLSRETLQQILDTAGHKTIARCFVRSAYRHPIQYIRLLKQSRSFTHCRVLISQGIARLKQAASQ